MRGDRRGRGRPAAPAARQGARRRSREERRRAAGDGAGHRRDEPLGGGRAARRRTDGGGEGRRCDVRHRRRARGGAHVARGGGGEPGGDTAEDVARVNEVARAISLGRDQELLHDIPQEYRVDQQHGISDPVGMTGTRLEVEMYLVTVQATAAQNLRKAVQRAGYRVLDLVLEPLAASYAVLTEDEKELGVALLEVGGGSTGVTIFHEGKIRHLASLKYAGAQVTTDVVQVLGVTQADAERLKERHGVAYKPLVDPAEMITLPSTPGQGDHLRRVH